MNHTITILEKTARTLIRLVFGSRCISIKGEAGVPFRFRPAETPIMLLGPSRVEPEVWSNWTQLLGDDEMILDIGANIGGTVQRLFSILNGKCYIWAFEPMPRNLELLVINSRALNSDRVFIINHAVGDHDGEAVFFDNINHGALSALSQIASPLSSANNRQAFFWKKHLELSVQMVKLDTFLKNHPRVRPTFVKIDVEGAGVMVLVGARDMLRRYRPAFDCEFHSSEEQAGMIHILKEAGYRGLVFHSDARPSLCDPRDSKRSFVHPSDPRLGRLNLVDLCKKLPETN